MGPCLCGDPACGRCFPSGQAPVRCPDCGWTGKICDLGFESDEGVVEDGFEEGCPECGSTVKPLDVGPLDDTLEERRGER